MEIFLHPSPLGFEDFVRAPCVSEMENRTTSFDMEIDMIHCGTNIKPKGKKCSFCCIYCEDVECTARCFDSRFCHTEEDAIGCSLAKDLSYITTTQMTMYDQLCAAEQVCHTIEIEEIDSRKVGVANTVGGMVAVFYGADDGSEDTIVTPEEFNRRFEITAKLR